MLLRRQGDRILVRGHKLVGRQVVTRLTPLLGPGIRVRAISIDSSAEGQEAAPAPEFVDLSDERRARLVAFIEGNGRMPSEMKERLLSALAQPQVPAGLVERIESRMGG